MLDYSQYKPNNRSYSAGRIGTGRQEWIPIALALAAYLVATGVECLFSGFGRRIIIP